MRTNYVGKPFVKWVGGKSQLLPALSRRLPEDFGRWENAVYVEPFIGGGAMLFWMLQTFPNIKRAYINDINTELIATYRAVRDTPWQLIARLAALQKEYCRLGEAERKEYYLQRRELFNAGSNDDIDTASLLIFLNRTCFNGLYRVNAKGIFNVPFGRYANPKICEAETITADSTLLRKVEITCNDFSATLQYASPHTFYYLDPPYKPLSKTSSFKSYNKETFGNAEQIRLCEYCKTLAAKGSRFILSNSDLRNSDPDNTFFDDLYSPFYINRVAATRMVNANPDGRGKISELMVSNFQ